MAQKSLITKDAIIPVKNVSNPGSAIGEAIGDLIELEIATAVKSIAKDKLGLGVDVGGPVPGKREGKKLLMKDRFGNDYEIDILIEDTNQKPLVLIETKWLRYTKHNRDKGSWVCTAHYSLRKTYSSIRKTMVVLAGNWSGTSIELIKSFDIEVHHIPYEHVVGVLSKYGIQFDWEEKDREAATLAWNRFNDLSEKQLQDLANEITKDVIPAFTKSLTKTLSDKSDQRSLEEVEITIKSSLGELFNKSFKTVEEAIEYLKRFDFE